jgi:N-acetylglucosaminyldiphosphoundecaprenol N-acetyl-beta-D-mannosaminyltransferase
MEQLRNKMRRLRTSILGIEVDCVDQATLIGVVLDRARLGFPGYILTINLHHLVKLRSDDGNLRSAFAKATYVVPDGRPLLWMARLRGIKLHLITGSDFLVPMCQAAARQKRSVFFFGTTFDALAECARRIHASVNGLDIRGVYSPPFGFERDPHERLLAESAIKAAAPDIVFIALAVPRQEIWTRDNAERLGSQLIPVGAAIDFIAGKQRRAPLAIRRMGFEWLWRALTDPRRLAKRYAIMLCWFPILAISDLMLTRRQMR